MARDVHHEPLDEQEGRRGGPLFIGRVGPLADDPGHHAGAADGLAGLDRAEIVHLAGLRRVRPAPALGGVCGCGDHVDEVRVLGVEVLEARHRGLVFLAVVGVVFDGGGRANSSSPRFSNTTPRCDASSRLIEETDGLHEVLTSAEMLASDVAADRDDRRAAEGYVSPASAAAFLKHAEQTPLEELVAATGDDPITRAYFRAVRDTPVSTEGSLVELLRSADVLPPAPRAIGTGASTPLKDAIAALSPELQATRMEELAYLANVLLSARGMRRVEAAETAVSIANLGLEHLRDPTTNAVKLFRVGWHRYARQGRAD